MGSEFSSCVETSGLSFTHGGYGILSADIPCVSKPTVRLCPGYEISDWWHIPVDAELVEQPGDVDVEGKSDKTPICLDGRAKRLWALSPTISNFH